MTDHDTRRRQSTEKTTRNDLSVSVSRCVIGGVLRVVMSGRRVGALMALVLLLATPARADEIKVMTSGAFTEQQVSTVSAAIATKSKAAAAAKTLIDFLASPDAAGTIHKTGLEPIARTERRQ